MTESPSIQILVTPDFQGQLRKLAKRYRSIRSDLQPLFDDLESGNCPGDQISGTTIPFSKSVPKTVTFKKANVRAIGSFTNCETKSAFCLSLSIPNPTKPLSQPVKFAKSSIASMNPPKLPTQKSPKMFIETIKEISFNKFTHLPSMRVLNIKVPRIGRANSL
jgi:hypothetical protein